MRFLASELPLETSEMGVSMKGPSKVIPALFLQPFPRFCQLLARSARVSPQNLNKLLLNESPDGPASSGHGVMDVGELAALTLKPRRALRSTRLC